MFFIKKVEPIFSCFVLSVFFIISGCCCFPSGPNISDYYLVGIQFLTKGDNEQAIIAFNKFLNMVAIPINNTYIVMNLGRGMTLTDPILPSKAWTRLRSLDSTESPILIGKDGVGNYYSLSLDENTTLQYTVPSWGRRTINCFFNRGLAYYGKGLYDQAISDFDLVLRLIPTFYKGYLARGDAYSKNGYHEQAIVDYNRALELNPRLAEAFVHLGYSYYVRGLYDQAILNLNKAIEINPNYIETYYRRGVIFLAQGKYSEATSDFKKLLEVDQKNANDFAYEAVSYEKTGLDKEAAEAYEKVISNMFSERKDIEQLIVR